MLTSSPLPPLGEARTQELQAIAQKYLADLHYVSPLDSALVYRLANIADGRIRAVLGSGPFAPNVDVVFPVVPLPADTILAGEIRQQDLNYVAVMLLAVIAWLLTFAGPVMISKLSQADQSTMTDYYSGIPALALMLTGYLITHRPKGK